MVNSNPQWFLTWIRNSLAKALSSIQVQGIQVSTECSLPFLVIVFFFFGCCLFVLFCFLTLKRPIVTSDFLSSFAGEGRAGDLKEKASVPGSSCQRGYKGKQREKESQC